MRLVVDVDGTLTIDEPGVAYQDKRPRLDVIKRVNILRSRGAKIVIYTARNMRSHQGNLGVINKLTLPVLMGWLDRYDVGFDEIYMGKPWCGSEGFYVARNAIRPDDFTEVPLNQIESWMRRVAAGKLDRLDE
jgi:capsule biosynthesis phosphatase